MLLIKNVRYPHFDTLTTEKCDVLIDNGRFVRFAPELRAEAPVLDGGGRLLLPGMTDVHTHMVQSLTKGPLDDLNITDWLKKMLAVQWSLTEEEWYYGVLLGCLQALRCGVTTINEMTYFPHIDAVVKAYQDAGIRVSFGIGATDIAENPQTKTTPIKENLRQAAYIYDKYHGKGLLRTTVAPQGRPACTPELMQALKRFADERGLLYHTHLAEGRAQTDWVARQTGRGECEELDYLGVLNEHTVLAHTIWLTDAELELLVRSGAGVAYCPSTNMKLSDGIAKVARMTELGIPVGFGCDGEASSANRDLIREAAVGSYLQKAQTLDATVLPAQQCWKMLTGTGAKMLGYPLLGKLKPGSPADFSLVNTEELFTTNQARVLNNLLFAGSGRQVDSVFVGGEPVLQDGRFVHHDIEKVLAKCEEILSCVETRLRLTEDAKRRTR